MKKNRQIQKKIQDYWIKTPDLFAEKYTSPLLAVFSPANAFLQSRRKKVLALVGDLRDKKVLDVGCGSGIFMVDFIKRGAMVTGVDYSQKMLEMAKNLLNQQKISSSRYWLVKAEATNLPFKKREFDIILATGLADYLSQAQNELFLLQASKVVKKNGLLICGFPIKESPVGFLRYGFGLWLREHLFKLPPIESYFSLSEIRAMLKKADLKETKHLKVFSTMWIIVAKHV